MILSDKQPCMNSKTKNTHISTWKRSVVGEMYISDVNEMYLRHTSNIPQLGTGYLFTNTMS